MRAILRVLAIGVFLTALEAVAVSAQEWVDVYNPQVVLTLNLQMSDADWDTIRHDLTNEIEVPAQFWADGETPILVSVRRKSSRALPSEGNPIKFSMKVDVNEFDDQKWHGLTKLSLENGSDTDPIAEGLAWNLHEMASVDGFYGAGYHAGLAAWARLNVNGSYIGVYVNVEERDKQFLRNRGLFFGDSSTWLYEIDERSAGFFEHEVGGPAHSPLWDALCYAPFQVVARRAPQCATPNDATLATELPAVIDMLGMLTQGAIDAFSSNNDALFSHGKNFRFADFATELAQKRRYYMWDLDAAITDTGSNIYAQKAQKGKNVSYTQTDYQRIILNHPTFRAQYNTIVSGLIGPGGPISEAAIHGFLNAVEATSMSAALAADPYAGFASAGAVSSLFSGYRDWASRRIPIVQGQVAANLPAPRP